MNAKPRNISSSRLGIVDQGSLIAVVILSSPSNHTGLVSRCTTNVEEDMPSKKRKYGNSFDQELHTRERDRSTAHLPPPVSYGPHMRLLRPNPSIEARPLLRFGLLNCRYRKMVQAHCLTWFHASSHTAFSII
jgi:hypothetical protein